MEIWCIQKIYQDIFSEIYLLNLLLVVFLCCCLQGQHNVFQKCIWLCCLIFLPHIYFFHYIYFVKMQFVLGWGVPLLLHGLWRFHCPHLRRQYLFNDNLYWYFHLVYIEFNKQAMCNNFHIAILLHAVLLYCLYEQSSAHISFWLILFLQFCLGRLKHKHIICSQIKFYATIEPCIYIMILPITRGEVGGLVPRLKFWNLNLRWCARIMSYSWILV